MVTDPKTGKHPWMENFEGLALAIIMALTLKYFVIEAYKIPTGSMQPTLMGFDKGGLQIFDRILVDKLAYLNQEPKRWEVVVFKYPLDQSKNYIKRLVGLPGDTLRIEGGNLYRQSFAGDYEILRKPARTQKDIWKQVYDSGGFNEDARASEDFWVQESGNWTFDNGKVQSVGAGKIHYKRPIKDAYADGYPKPIQATVAQYGRDSEQNVVGDLRVSFRVNPAPGCQTVQCTIGAGDRRYHLVLAGPNGDNTSKVFVGSEILENFRFKLATNKASLIRFAHYDESVDLEIDGKNVFHYDFPYKKDHRWNILSNLVEIESSGGGCSFENLQIDRDLFYTQMGARSEWEVPHGMFFFLGDNTQDSYDGRLWTETVCYLDPKNPGESRVELHGDSGSGTGDRNPRVINVQKGETIYSFVDWFGETHRFSERALRGTPQLEHPFVPREFIVGKAILVFWPVPPFSPIPRWKLIY